MIKGKKIPDGSFTRQLQANQKKHGSLVGYLVKVLVEGP